MSKLTNDIFKNGKHYLSSKFGKRAVFKTSNGASTSSFHNGCDYATYGKKLPQYAVADGTIISCGVDSAYGGAKYVWVSYPSLKVKMLHYHLDSYNVKSGQSIKKGGLIGYTGKTGNVTGIHLHLGIKRLSGGDYINPETWASEEYPSLRQTGSTDSSNDSSKTDATIKSPDSHDFSFSSKSSSGFLIYVVKPNDKIKKYNITELISSVSWGGSSEQASRSLSFDYARDPKDTQFSNFLVETGDVIAFYFDKKLRYVGLAESISLGAGTTSVTVQSHDYLNLLLLDSVSYTFKNKNANEITRKVCKDVGISIKSLPRVKKQIKKWIIEGDNAYNVIISAYYKEFKKTGVKYFPIMESTKLSIMKKGENSGVKLKLGTNIISTSVSLNSDNVINRVVYFDEDGYRLGVINDTDSQNRYGVRQTTYTKEDGVDVKTGAKKLLADAVQEVNVSAIGSIEAISGRSIHLYDSNSGLEGKFWIESDTHTFSNGLHQMTLKLSFKNVMEGQNADNNYPDAKSSHVAYYSDGGKCFHSKKDCGGANLQHKTTVSEAKKQGKKKCSRCWN